MADEIASKMIKGAISQNEYRDQSRLFSLILNEAQGLTSTNNINYINGDPFKNKPSEQPSTASSKTDEGWAIDIAQSHHFTVEIRDVKNHKSRSGNLLSYRTPNNVYSNFLPVKSMSLAYPSYENMNVPLSIFGDFPLLMRRRVENITLVCYDEDTSQLEKNLQAWNEECFPQGKYVAYMDDVVKELIYRGYTVDGRESMNVRRLVIPTGQVNVSRDYSENEAKMITFSLACVGDGSTCAVGSPSVITNVPVSSGTPSNSDNLTQEIKGNNVVGNKTKKSSLANIPAIITSAPKKGSLADKPAFYNKAPSPLKQAFYKLLYQGPAGFLH